MEQTTFKVILIFDSEGWVSWPENTPTPLVGDEITASIKDQSIIGKVVKREWGIAVHEAPSVQIAVLRIIVESRPEAQRAPATVQPLKL